MDSRDSLQVAISLAFLQIPSSRFQLMPVTQTVFCSEVNRFVSDSLSMPWFSLDVAQKHVSLGGFRRVCSHSGALQVNITRLLQTESVDHARKAIIKQAFCLCPICDDYVCRSTRNQGMKLVESRAAGQRYLACKLQGRLRSSSETSAS